MDLEELKDVEDDAPDLDMLSDAEKDVDAEGDEEVDIVVDDDYKGGDEGDGDTGKKKGRGGKKGRGNGRGNGRGKGRCGGTGGRPTAVKAGKRACGDCGVQKALCEFRPGNAVCIFPCSRIRDNVYKVCKAANDLEWYWEQRRNQAKWKQVKRWYLNQCGGAAAEKKECKLKRFGLLQFKSHARVEAQLLRDGVYEMMHLIKFQCWAAKAKNMPPRGLTAAEAEALFKQRAADPETIVDEDGPYNGPNEDYRVQIGVKVKSLVTNRNMISRGQGSMHKWLNICLNVA